MPSEEAVTPATTAPVAPSDAAQEYARTHRPPAPRRHVPAGIFLGSGLLLILLAWWRDDTLPPPERLLPAALVEPVEEAVDDVPYHTLVGGTDYALHPKYSYEIAGLVVSLHHSDAWWDTAHRAAQDKLNVADLCLVWGDNARHGVYQGMQFTSGEWTCYYQPRTAEAGHAFIPTQMSNNHVLADRSDIARALTGVHVGDQIRMRGTLVDYEALHNGAVVSTRTTSHGHNGHNCEVMHVSSVETLKASDNGVWRVARLAGEVLLAVGAVAWVLARPRLDDDARF